MGRANRGDPVDAEFKQVAKAVWAVLHVFPSRTFSVKAIDTDGESRCFTAAAQKRGVIAWPLRTCADFGAACRLQSVMGSRLMRHGHTSSRRAPCVCAPWRQGHQMKLRVWCLAFVALSMSARATKASAAMLLCPAARSGVQGFTAPRHDGGLPAR